MVIDHIGKDGKVDARAFYGESKLKFKDIHTTAHGNPKQHPHGNHGEHAHDYTWGEDGRLKDKTTRELSRRGKKGEWGYIMNKDELRQILSECCNDISFSYRGL